MTAMRTAIPNVTCGRMTDWCHRRRRSQSPRHGSSVRDAARSHPVWRAPALWRQSVARKVLTGRRQQRAAHALVLQPQHGDDIDAFEASSSEVNTRTPRRSMSAGNSVRGPMMRSSGTPAWSAHESVNAPPAVQHVAHDRHRQAGEIFLVVTDREYIQQALRGVLVTPVSGVNHAHVAPRAVRSDAVRRFRCGGPRTCRHASR